MIENEKKKNRKIKPYLAWGLVAVLGLVSILLAYDDIRIRVKIAYHENYAKGFKDASLYISCQEGTLPSQQEIEILKTVDVSNCRDVEKVIAKSSTWVKEVIPSNADLDGTKENK